MATVTEITFDKHQYNAEVTRLWTPTLTRFSRLIRFSIFFNVVFLLIAMVEVALFLSFFALLSQSAVLAFTLAIFFLTVFSYFVLRLYIQAKRPEQLLDLCDEYLHRCKEMIHYQEGIPEHHIALANAAHKFASALHEKEYLFLCPPHF